MARRNRNDRPRRASERPAETRTVTRSTTVAPGYQRAPRHVVVARAKDQVRATTAAVNDGQHRASRAAALPSSSAPDQALKTPGHLFSEPYESKSLGESARAQPRADTPLDQRKCKAKPASNKGTGKGRSFVPWCK